MTGVELAIPLLLLGTRTRHAGVLVGVTFHVIIALNRTHPFFDFSTALIALLVRFLPGSFAQSVTEGAARIRAALAAAVPATGVSLALGIVVVAAAEVTRRMSVTGPILAQGPEILWYAYGVGALGLIVAFLSGRPAPEPGLLRLPRRWLAAVPLLALLNGITPYLEVKTGYCFNTYSNLVTRGGQSNHLLVRRTLPLTGRQADLVRIISSSDRRLQRYGDEDWDLPWLLFRDYLSRRPGVAVHYERRGQRHDLARPADDPTVVESVPSWERRLFAYRLVDRRDPPRGQTSYQAAR